MDRLLKFRNKKISSWDVIDNSHRIVSSGFYKFVLQELSDAKDNW